MQNTRHFSSLVVAALVSWAAVAGVLALSPNGDAGPSGTHSVSNAFPTAEAGFAPRPAPVD